MAEMMESDVKNEDKTQENIWIFLDDSYTWIEAKKAAAQAAATVKSHSDKLKTNRIRISVGGLFEIVRKNRNIKESNILYGSKPPPIDSVWKKAEKYDFKVKCHKSIAAKEKIDSKLVADVTEMVTRILRYIAAEHGDESTTKGVIAIICGDADCSSAIEIALKYKWNVEVYLWSGASSHYEIKKLVRTFRNQLRIFNLDDYLSRITFIEKEINVKNSIRLQAEIRASGVVLHIKQEQVHGESFKQMEKLIESFSRCPIQYFSTVDQHGERKNDVIILYFKREKDQQFDIENFIETFNKSFPSLAQPYQQYLQ